MSAAFLARLNNLQRQIDDLTCALEVLHKRLATLEAERLAAGAKVGRN